MHELAERIDPLRHRVDPGKPARLSERDPADTGGLTATRKEARNALAALGKEVAELQEKLFAEDRQSLLLVLQAMDTGGKDSTIRAVTKGINPQGCRVYGFKAPSKKELARDYLWRVHAEVPPKGHVGIFNRSHYEDVLIVRVHGWAEPTVIEQRYEQINAFERLLSESGTRIVKVKLHISKAYQLERLRRRLNKPDKHWKFNPGDLEERALWSDYMDAYEVALTRCSTARAPWYIVPAQNRWYRNLIVARLVRDALRDMAPEYPAPSFDPTEFRPETLR